MTLEKSDPWNEVGEIMSECMDFCEPSNTNVNTWVLNFKDGEILVAL